MKKIPVRVMFTVAMFACLSLLPACEDQVVPPKPVPPVVHPEPIVGVLYMVKEFTKLKQYAVVEKQDSVDVWINYLVEKDDNSYRIEDVKNQSMDIELFSTMYQVVSALNENQQAAFSILKKSLEK